MPSEMSKELRLWAKDDIVPADLQHLCKEAADCHDDLVAACEYTQTLLSKGVGQYTHALALLRAILAKVHNKE